MSSVATNRLENLHTLRMANLDGALATACGSLIGGAFLTGYINSLGGNDFWINLAGALPALAGLSQVPGGLLSKRSESYKKFIIPFGYGWRIFQIPIAALPFVPMPEQLKLLVVMLAVGLAALSGAMVGPAYNEWLAELVPSTSRGFYFARRNSIITATGATAGLLGAFILDAFRRMGQENTGFGVIFILAILFASASFFFYYQMHDLKRAHVVRQPLGPALAELRGPFVDARFRAVLVFLFLFTTGQAFAGNLFNAYALKTLELPYTIIQWAAVSHALGNVLSASLWGFLSDKYGNKPVLYLTGAGLVISPTVWLFCQPGQDLLNAALLMPTFIVVGATWAGVALCQYNLMLATAKPEDRANYLAVTLTTQSIVGFVMPLAGVQAFFWFESRMDPDTAYKAVFGVTMALRAVALFWLFPVREEGATQFRRTLRDLTRVTPRGIRAMRTLSAENAEARRGALEDLATSRNTLAIDEIERALHDPSPRVRRQAADTLARLNHPGARHALIHQIEFHPDLLEEETVEALGQLGERDCVPALVTLLHHPRSMIRRAAAKSLARIGDSGAIEPLTEAASSREDPDLRRAALQGLRQLDARGADLEIADALFDPTPAVRIAAAEAVSELELGRALPYVRQSLSYYQDEAMAEVTYALGVIGSAEDLPLILSQAAMGTSVITRRRCLLAAARILGVESEAFRLFSVEGMSRDSQLMAMAQGLARDDELREALTLYSSGSESAAIQKAVSRSGRAELGCFAEYPVEEGFLVVVPYLVKLNKMSASTGGTD